MKIFARVGLLALSTIAQPVFAQNVMPHLREHGGLILALNTDAFLVAGTGLTITFRPRRPDGGIAGIERTEEGYFDEVGIQRLSLYRYC